MKVLRLFAVPALVFALGASALADTIRMKDGQVIRGQIVGFRDQQFTVLIGSSRGGSRRSRMTLNMEDVESIEFDNADGADDRGRRRHEHLQPAGREHAHAARAAADPAPRGAAP